MSLPRTLTTAVLKGGRLRLPCNYRTAARTMVRAVAARTMAYTPSGLDHVCVCVTSIERSLPW